MTPALYALVPGQPSKFRPGAVADTSIELTWEPAYEKEGIISYELRYSEVSFGSQVKTRLKHFFRFLQKKKHTHFEKHILKKHNLVYLLQQMKKTFGPTSSYVVEGLQPNTEYQFTLAAISNKGIGAFTNDVSQKTLQASM